MTLGGESMIDGRFKGRTVKVEGHCCLEVEQGRAKEGFYCEKGKAMQGGIGGWTSGICMLAFACLVTRTDCGCTGRMSWDY